MHRTVLIDGARCGHRPSHPPFGVARKLSNGEGLPAAAGLTRHTPPEAEKAGVPSSIPLTSRPATTARIKSRRAMLAVRSPSCSPSPGAVSSNLRRSRRTKEINVPLSRSASGDGPDLPRAARMRQARPRTLLPGRPNKFDDLPQPLRALWSASLASLLANCSSQLCNSFFSRRQTWLAL